MTYQNDATERFVTLVAEIQIELRRLQALVDDHLGVDAEDVKWGNCGDAQSILAALREIGR